jgi:hypothetical protein
MLLCNHLEELDELRERLGLVVCAVPDIATLRAEISEPRQGLMATASLCGCHAGDREFAVVPALRVGADAPSGVVAAIPAPVREGSTV